MNERNADFGMRNAECGFQETIDRPVRSPEEVFAAAVSHERRKARGQFFTPPVIARAMARWACARGPKSLLDPAVGPGIFLAEAAALDDIISVRAVGIDVDGMALKLARGRLAVPSKRNGWHGRGFVRPCSTPRHHVFDTDGECTNRTTVRLLELREADFLSVDLAKTFDAILCNPPYIRHHEAKLPAATFGWFDDHFGVRLSRLTNTYCLFLLKILTLLSPRGRAAVITPSEFLNADFGRVVKRILLNSGLLRGFVICDYREAIFDGVMTTATITLLEAHRAGSASARSGPAEMERRGARRAAPGAGRHIAFAHADSMDAVAAAIQSIESGSARAIAPEELDPAAKWATGRRPQTGHATSAAKTPMRPLSDFARCTRGIATGANDFFTLSDEEVRRWSLPGTMLRRCVTKAAHAAGPRFTRDDFEALRAAGRKAWLLDVTGENGECGMRSAESGLFESFIPNSAFRTPHSVSAYLAHGESLGVHQRYLTRHRSPWYLAERRAPADIWAAVFGRGRLRFVHNAAGVLSLTTFHAVYLQERYRRFLPLLMVYFHSALFDRFRATEQRVYGDGLLKMEPRDVERLMVPNLDTVDDRTMEEAGAVCEALATRGSANPGLMDRIDAMF